MHALNHEIPHCNVEVIAGAKYLLHLVVLLVALQHILNDLVAVGRVKMAGQRSMHRDKLKLPRKYQRNTISGREIVRSNSNFPSVFFNLSSTSTSAVHC